MSQCAVSQATAHSGATLRAHSRVYELSTYVACRLNGLALPSLSPRSHPPMRSITPARAHTLALEPMPPRRGHVKSLSGLWPARSPWIWHCAQIYLPGLGVVPRMGWIRSFQEVHLPRALDPTLRALEIPVSEPHCRALCMSSLHSCTTGPCNRHAGRGPNACPCHEAQHRVERCALHLCLIKRNARP